MTTYNTGNPVGSVDVRDLYDNAQNLDVGTNSTALTWTDRRGVSRKSWAGMEADFAAFLLASGYEFLGDYDADGPLLIERPNQVFTKDGEYWRSGPALTLPYTTVNNWVTDGPKFVSAGDAVLRGDLAADDGAELVGHGDGTVAETFDRRPFGSSVSFVDRLVGAAPVKDMYVITRTGSGLPRSLGIGYVYEGTDDPCAEYQMEQDAMGWWRIWGGFTGYGIASNQPQAGFEPTLSGAYNQASSTTSTYTTTVGNTWSVDVSGVSKPVFVSNCDNRGGIWRIRINGVIIADISVWRASSGTVMQTLNINLDPARTYKVEGEFMGADPLNAPSDGTARGWITYRPTTGEYTTGIRAMMDYYKTRRLDFDHATRPPRAVVSNVGINEFAIRVRPVGSADQGEWIPSHSSAVITDLVESKLYVDGVLTSTAPATIPVRRHCKQVVMDQRYTFKFPGGSDLGILNTRHTFDSQGRCVFDYKIYALTDFEVGDTAYGAQFSTIREAVSSLSMNNGVDVDKSSLALEESYDLAYDNVTSAAFLGQSSSSIPYQHGFAIDVDLTGGRHLNSVKPPVSPAMLMTTREFGDVWKLYWKWPLDDLIEQGTSIHCRSVFGIATAISPPNELGFPALGSLI